MHINTKQDIIKAFEALLESREAQERFLKKRGNGWLNRYDFDVFSSINDTAEHNSPWWMSSKCGQTAGLVSDFFAQCDGVECVSVTAGVQNGCMLHIYNLMKLDNGEILLFDGSAAQFFTDPMDAFNGRPYFIGTRQDLKGIVLRHQEKSWQTIQSHMPSVVGFKNIRHADYACLKDAQTSRNLESIFKDAESPRLLTVYLSMGWETTWGDQSLLRPMADKADEKVNLDDWGRELVRDAEVCLLLPDPHCFDVPVCLDVF